MHAEAYLVHVLAVVSHHEGSLSCLDSLREHLQEEGMSMCPPFTRRSAETVGVRCKAVTAARNHLPGLLFGLVDLMGSQVAQRGGAIPDHRASGCIGGKLLAWQLDQQLPLSTCAQHLVKVVCALGAGICLLCHLQHDAGGLLTTDRVCLMHCMRPQHCASRQTPHHGGATYRDGRSLGHIITAVDSEMRPCNVWQSPCHVRGATMH